MIFNRKQKPLAPEQRHWAWLDCWVNDGIPAWVRWNGPANGIVNISRSWAENFGACDGWRAIEFPTEDGGRLRLAVIEEEMLCNGWTAARCDGWFYFSWRRHWLEARLKRANIRAMRLVADFLKARFGADYRPFYGERMTWGNIFAGVRKA